MHRCGVSAYATLHARVRAMYSTMLTPQMWSSLFEAQNLVSMISTLRETIYASYLSKVEKESLSPQRAVFQIKGHLAGIHETMVHLAPKHARPLITQLCRLSEIDNLKAVLRGIVAGAKWDTVKYVLIPLGSLTTLPAQQMMETGSVGAAVDKLRGTPYYITLTHAMRRYTAEKSLFPLEVALDLYYWRELWDDVNSLPQRDHEHAMQIVGMLMDINNLMWAIRYREYNHLSEEEIINYTLPFGWRVKDKDIHAIAAGANIAQVVKRDFPELSQIGSALKQSNGALSKLELQLQRQVVNQCRAAFIGFPFHIGIPLAYLILNRMEIQDLTVLIEAKSRQIPAERFRPYLVMGYPSEGQSG